MSALLVQARFAHGPAMNGSTVHVTARTGREVISMEFCTVPAEQQGPWRRDQLVDEHVAVHGDARLDWWRLAADVMVRNSEGRGFDGGAALIRCEFDPSGRRCDIETRGHGRLRFIARTTPNGPGAFADGSAFAASFAHTWLVAKGEFAALREATLVISRPGGEVTLIPSDRTVTLRVRPGGC